MEDFKKLRVLHVLSQRPDSTGSGIYVQAMIKESAALGYDNYLVAGAHSGNCDETDQCDSMFVKFHDSDVSYHIPGMSDIMPYTSSRFCDLSPENLAEYEKAFSKILVKAVQKFQPDIIHSHHLWIVSSITRKLFPKIPMATTCHGTDLRQFQNCSHLQSKVLPACQQIDIIMALSDAQKKEIVRLYNIQPEKIIITGAGFNNSLFYPGNKPEPEPVQLVYAGKLSNAKGVPWMLKALKSINTLPWQLHLIGSGSGEEMENCLKLAKELGKKITIHGALPQKKLAEIMRQSHILVLPSFYEGLPLVILEGLASGCRIVSNDLPGVKEITKGFIGPDSSSKKYISLVKTPRLKNLDQPYKEDSYTFEKNLKEALQEQIMASLESPQIDLTLVIDIINSFTWKGIFKLVKKAYISSLKRT